jgi:hypothetical protein
LTPVRRSAEPCPRHSHAGHRPGSCHRRPGFRLSMGSRHPASTATLPPAARPAVWTQGRHGPQLVQNPSDPAPGGDPGPRTRPARHRPIGWVPVPARRTTSQARFSLVSSRSGSPAQSRSPTVASPRRDLAGSTPKARSDARRWDLALGPPPPVRRSRAPTFPQRTCLGPGPLPGWPPGVRWDPISRSRTRRPPRSQPVTVPAAGGGRDGFGACP